MSLQLSETQVDLLREVANIGSGHAMTALSQLLGRKVSLHVPAVRLLSVNEMEFIAGETYNIAVCIYFRIFGEAKGNILIVLPKESAGTLINVVGASGLPETISREFSIEDESFLPPYEASVLKEVGNILTGAYLNAIGQVLNLTLIQSTPGLAVDSVKAVLATVLADVSSVNDKAVLIETRFMTETSITGHFFLLPDSDSLEYFFNVLG